MTSPSHNDEATGIITSQIADNNRRHFAERQSCKTIMVGHAQVDKNGEHNNGKTSRSLCLGWMNSEYWNRVSSSGFRGWIREARNLIEKCGGGNVQRMGITCCGNKFCYPTESTSRMAQYPSASGLSQSTESPNLPCEIQKCTEIFFREIVLRNFETSANVAGSNHIISFCSELSYMHVRKKSQVMYAIQVIRYLCLPNLCPGCTQSILHFSCTQCTVNSNQQFKA